MNVRIARPEDYQEAGRMTALAYSEFAPPGHEVWQNYLGRIEDVASRAGMTTVLVASDGERILGSATLELDSAIGDEGRLGADEANLRMLGVAPEARGRGAGRALVQACIERAQAAGKAVLTLRTAPEMTAAQSLYESIGFSRDPERDWPVSGDVTLLAFRLPLR